MTNKGLKDFRNAIHKNLKIEPQNSRSSCFIISENEPKSTIKQIQFTFTHQDNILILKQDKTKEFGLNYTIENLFENQENIPNTNTCCDFIAFLIFNNELKIYCCEIKSSYCEKHINKAINQIESSRLFVSYLLDYYFYIGKLKCKLKSNIEKSESELRAIIDEFKDKIKETRINRLYIYPKINSSNKTHTYYKEIKYKSVDIDIQGCAKITNGYEFFKNL